MFIQTEETPNPNAMKFLPSRLVLGESGGGPVHITDARAAGISPLAEALFAVNGVHGVLLGRDFITVTKRPDDSWEAIKPSITAAIIDHFTSGMPVMAARRPRANVPDIDIPPPPEIDPNSEDYEIIQQILELLDTRVRPAVANDGGDIVFHSFRDGVVYLSMKGSCSGCPRSTATLKMGIENLLKHYVPEVKEVREARKLVE